MGCCAAKPEPTMRKKKSTRFKSLKTAKSMTKFPGKNRSECESEADIKSNVSSVFDKYDFKKEGYLGEKEIRFMIMEMASTRKADITMKDIDKYV